MKSSRLIKHFGAIAHWARGLRGAAACWRASEAGIEFSDEEFKKLIEALQALDRAEKLVTEIYSKRIGDAIAEEIKRGDR